MPGDDGRGLAGSGLPWKEQMWRLLAKLNIEVGERVEMISYLLEELQKYDS